MPRQGIRSSYYGYKTQSALRGRHAVTKKNRFRGGPRSRMRAQISRPLATRNVGTVRGSPFPQKLNTKLIVLERQGLISALTSSYSYVYRPTSYFDFDPGVGGQTFGGYGDLASIYDRYRVLGWIAEVEFINLESTGVTVSIEAISDSSTPPSGTALDYTEYAIENSNFSRYMTLAPVTSNPKGKLKLMVTTEQVWGTPEVKTDTIFAAASGGSPAANTWLRIAGHLNNNAAMTVGIQYTLKLTSYGYWDERIDKVA